MSDPWLQEQLDKARGEVYRIERAIAGAPCSEVGHRWVSIGGSNAGCGPTCCCSVPVHECSVCKDCDYGDNPDAHETIAKCEDRHPISN